ncbi:MAG TPA: thiol reductant ABC exporter subunit CydD [Anaerolineaceae bacterium]|nr:thiol reductant ABC exporter subunit CydD [Anaerolineaceae bacterium]
MNLDPRLLRQAWQARFALLATILLGLLGALAIVFQARMLSQIVAGVFIDHHTLAQVQPLLILLLGVILLRVLVSLAGDLSANAVAVKVKNNLRTLLMRRWFERGPAGAEQQTGATTGEVTAAAIQGIESLEAYFSQYLPQLILSALIPLAILTVVFPLDWLSGLALLVTAPLIPIFMRLVGSASQTATGRQWQALGRLSAFFLDTLQGLSTLKALGRSLDQAQKVASVADQYRLTTMRVLRVTFLSALVLELVSTISTAVVAVEIGIRLLYGRIAFEQAFFVLLMAPEFYLPLRQLGLRFHAAMMGISAAQQIFDLLALPVPESTHLLESSLAAPNLQPPFEICFNSVSYTYPGRQLEALDNLSFTLHAGKVTALVGPSGSGKTTIVNLLLRFIQPQSGAIWLNDQPLSGFDLAAWRQQIAWVPQQPHLFHDTIAANIRLAWPAASPEDVRLAARQAGLADWIEALPQSYNTLVGESGARLSTGQVQRLALARAFLRPAPILILDEPSAYLDPALEVWLEQSIHQLCVGRTALVIAHRLTTIQQANQILFLSNGRVVESGTHADLLSAGGSYAALLSAYRGGR